MKVTIKNVTSSGVEIGVIMAMILSWSKNASILWALFHGLCSWFYVIYYLLTH